MIIRTATFVKSSPDWTLCPAATLPEFAFIGRSNVGKSSLINMLASRKIALVSATPGKTGMINHFRINDSWHLVDLPGYGYVKSAKKRRIDFARMIDGYIINRQQLLILFVLLDCRLAPQAIDIEFINKLGEHQAPFSLIFTKIDKLSKTALLRNVENYKARLAEDWEEIPEIFLSSAETGAGRDEILACIGNYV
jgi:GTP-binding protein